MSNNSFNFVRADPREVKKIVDSSLSRPYFTRMEIKIIDGPISEAIVTETYCFEIDGQKITYIEYLENPEFGSKVIDVVIRDEDGNDIDISDAAAMLEEIQNLIDEKEQSEQDELMALAKKHNPDNK